MGIRLDTLLPRTHRILNMRQVNEQVRSFQVQGTFGAKAGQFAMVWVPGVDELPLSIVDDDGERTTFAFFVAGGGTQAMAEMTDGGLIGLRGPFGTSFDAAGCKRVVVIAGGYGSAPMLSAAKQVMKAGARIDILLGAKNDKLLLFVEDLKKLNPDSFSIATDDGSAGKKGIVTELLDELLAKDGKKIDCVFSCGPEPMLKQVSDCCAKHGVKAQLSAQRYMKCGYGLCGSCVVDPLGLRLCEEGPVISNDLFRQLTELGAYKRDDLGKRV